MAKRISLGRHKTVCFQQALFREKKFRDACYTRTILSNAASYQGVFQGRNSSISTWPQYYGTTCRSIFLIQHTHTIPLNTSDSFFCFNSSFQVSRVRVFTCIRACIAGGADKRRKIRVEVRAMTPTPRFKTLWVKYYLCNITPPPHWVRLQVDFRQPSFTCFVIFREKLACDCRQQDSDSLGFWNVRRHPTWSYDSRAFRGFTEVESYFLFHDFSGIQLLSVKNDTWKRKMARRLLQRPRLCEKATVPLGIDLVFFTFAFFSHAN